MCVALFFCFFARGGRSLLIAVNYTSGGVWYECAGWKLITASARAWTEIGIARDAVGCIKTCANEWFSLPFV